MSIRSALEASALHDEGFVRDPFPAWGRPRHDALPFHDTVNDVSARPNPPPCRPPAEPACRRGGCTSPT